MNKSLLIALGLCASSLSVVHAAPLISHTNHHALQQKLNGEGEYTDFTGTWSSPNCRGTDVTLIIENDEQTLTINNEDLTIGTVNVKSNSGQKTPVGTLITESNIQSVEWNTDKTELVIRDIDADKQFDIQDTHEMDVDTAMYTDIEVTTVSLKDGNLVLAFNNATFKDLQKIDSSHPTCTFTKVLALAK